MRLRKAAGERRTSDRRNNDVSWISEVKGISNVAVRKKRGSRAPPSAKKVDKVTDSDDAVDNYIDDRDEGQVGKNQSIECVDGKTGDPDVPKTGKSGNSSDGISSASEEQDHSTNYKDMIQKAESPMRSKQDKLHLEQEVVDSEPSGQNNLANEDGSNVQASVVKKGTDEERSSQEIKNNEVFDAQVNMTSSDDKSSEEFEDVKVCDMCGDVGEEEKLAVCSRCNDGAEHIYCMRVMMEEVPDSEWLCEDCHTLVEFEKKKKLEKCEVKVGTSKGQLVEGKMNKPLNAAKSSSSDSELEAEKLGNKESDTTNEGNETVSNRMEEDAAITSSVKETIQEPGGLYIGVDSRKKMLPSRESSFKFDADKGKQPIHQVATPMASNAPKNQAPQPRGLLLKSTSFNNSKVPKVKQLLNEVPQKPKSLKESWSSIIKKEGPVSMTTKSATFKKPKPCEPANKAKSSILSTAEGPKVPNPLVSQNVTNDRCTSILGYPSDTASTVAPVLSKIDTTAQHLTAGNNMSDSDNLSTTHGQGSKNSLGNNEIKKAPLAKVPGSVTLSNTEKSFGILGPGAQRKVIQNPDPSHRDNNVKDPCGFRPGASTSNRTIRCQRCNEVGHSTQFCAVDKVRLPATKPLSELLKEASAKRNRTSETSTLVATENAASRSADQSEQIQKCGIYQNPMYGPKDVLSALFSHVKKPTPLFVRTNEQDMKCSLSNPGSAASVDCSELKVKDDNPTRSAMIESSVNNGTAVPIDQRHESSQGFSNGDEPIASTVPELNYIWQGGFELQRTGKSPELCDGFQAHLSCSAPQLVLEIAKKFPSKVQLEELPRRNSWPIQFQESGPTYDNVGIFFFARDVQSYENHYSKLVENMLKNDLVLRGSVDTVELLIFPSNILSTNFQRWNMFYFLWGVFRVGRKYYSNLPPDVLSSRYQSNLNEDPRAVDPSASVLSSSHSFSQGMNNFAKPDPNLVNSTTCVDYQCPPSLEANHQGCLNGENSLTHVSGTPLGDHHDSVAARCATNNSGAIDHSTTTTGQEEKLNYSEHKDKTQGTFNGNVGETDFDVNMVPVDCSVPLKYEEEPGQESETINLNHAEHLMDIDHVNTTEVHTGALDPFSHVSGGARKRDFDMANGADEVDGAHEYKKIKLDTVVSANSGLCENINDGRLSSKVHPLASSSVDDGTGNKAMAGSTNSDGKCVFPLDLNAMDENIADVPSSDAVELREPSVAELELETGDDGSSKKAMLSSLSPKVREKQNMGDNLPTDITGSLSLSMGFSPRKEQSSKPQLELQRDAREKQ